MHHATKKAAVAKYAPLLNEGKSEQDIRAAIAADEKKYSPADIDEIYKAILDGAEGGTQTEEEDDDDKQPENKGGYNICEEWRVEKKKGAKELTFETAEKLKLLRKKVKLTDDALEQNNYRCNELNPIAYFPVN